MIDLAFSATLHAKATIFDGTDDAHPEPCVPASAILSHGLTTVEHVSAAANEGFAHFIAADVYNDHVESDGKFNYYKISDAFGFGRDVYLDDNLSVREVICGGGGNAGSLGNATGVEEDWLRFYWNLHSWINRDDNFRSLIDPDLTDDDRTREAKAQDIMLAIHAGAILDAAGGSGVASDAYYDILVAEMCDDNSRLVDFITKLNVDITVVRSVFFDFASEFGVWTGAAFSETC